MFNLILFGPPGSGKGTQSEKLIAKYHLTHVSTGNILRSEIAKKTPLGIKAKVLMDKGNLVPDHVVNGMIRIALDNNPHVSGFLFDGFPRTVAQAEKLDELLKAKDSDIDVMITLKVSDEELIKRLLKRGETSGRSDDNNELVVRSRIAEYHKKTQLVAGHYEKVNKVIVVKGEGSIEDIFQRLCHELDHLKAVNHK